MGSALQSVRGLAERDSPRVRPTFSMAPFVEPHRRRRPARAAAAAAAAAATLLAASSLAQDPPPSSGDYRLGNRLVLRPCAPQSENSNQEFYVTGSSEDAPGQIWWVGANNNWHVSMFSGGSTGWPAELYLSPTIAGNPLERWTEANRSAGSTGIDNDFVDHRCWEWRASPLAAGAAVRPALCSAGTTGATWQCDSPFPGMIQAFFDNGTASGLCVEPDPALTPDYVLDDAGGANAGAAYDGMGAIAGEGSARLLLDYDPAIAARVIDLLFAPGLLASLDMIKIEIGGDGNSIMGSTPSHRHASPLDETPDFSRGSQAWLAAQAKARNPALVVVALPWSFPGWLKPGGSRSPFADCPFSGPCLAASYVVEWLVGVREELGLVVDVIGTLSDYWDAATSPSYVKVLRTRLDAAGLNDVRIVCGEDGTFACAEAAVLDPALASAVGIFATHGAAAPSAAAAALGKRFWVTHRSSQGEAANLRGAAVLGAELAADAATGFSATLVWGTLCANYDGTPEHNNGLVRADSPTSGFFAITASLFAVAHTSRFARPGWNTLAASKTTNGGKLVRGGSYTMRYASGASPAWALTIGKFETSGKDSQNGLVGPEFATFQLAGTLYPQGASTAFVYVTAYGAVGNRNASFMRSTQNISIVGGHFSLWLDSNTHVTVTNVAPTAPLPVLTAPAVPAAFPASFSSDVAWASAAPGRSPPFLADINGAFEVVNDAVAGVAIQQMAASKPFTRYGTDTAPHAILGDQAWADVTANVEVFLRSAADSALFGVRCSGLHDSSNGYVTGMDAMPCAAWVNVSASSYSVVTRLDSEAVLLGSGGAGAVTLGAWSPLRAIARGTRVVVSAGSMLLASFNSSSVQGPPAPKAGFVAIGAGAFGAQPLFRALRIEASASICTLPPALNSSLFVEACAAGSAGQNFTLLSGAGRSGATVQLFLESINACVQVDDASAPDYNYPRARRVYLAACSGADGQQFAIESLAATDGNGLACGPIEGAGGVVLGSIGNSDVDDTEIIGFPFQGGSNSYWSFDAASGSFLNTFGGYCLSACQPI